MKGEEKRRGEEERRGGEEKKWRGRGEENLLLLFGVPCDVLCAVCTVLHALRALRACCVRANICVCTLLLS